MTSEKSRDPGSARSREGVPEDGELARRKELVLLHRCAPVPPLLRRSPTAPTPLVLSGQDYPIAGRLA